ncbi:MAG: glycoside hydrolase N-terminal domain-containing protein [Bacteroidia bacterium]|nr:glycoside hydrolase N-terminal domain-containing protein [Bacteroidia bacterium]
MRICQSNRHTTHDTRHKAHGSPNLEPGTWNLEPGTWNLEPGTNKTSNDMTRKYSHFSIIFLYVLVTGCNKPSESPDNSLKLWYKQPAVAWEEALPVGNGRLGAMVFGDPVNERIQLNEESI